jgi:hypothetical protein
MATTRIFVNERRTILVTIWPDGSMHVATRAEPSHIWGPPVRVTEEKT